MYSILLAIIYISFISLGLPDALLGSAWPDMHQTLNAPVSYAGVISMIIAGGTVLSSLACGRMIERLGTGKLTVVSVGMTAAALFGFSLSTSFLQLCLWAIPYGLGAGSVDAALNNFVALHYKAKHMNWLHCFWGVGAACGPYIMGMCLTGGFSWNTGYRTVSIIQVALTAALVFTLPLWKGKKDGAKQEEKGMKAGEALRLPGAKGVLAGLFCYASLEASTGLWAASYLAINRGIAAEEAAKFASFFYLGITAGRFFCGFLAMRMQDKNMVRLGQITACAGIACMLFPLGNGAACMGLILTGAGCAPVYPSLLHATPAYFGKRASQTMMGLQMACAYMGTTFMPPLFGLLQETVGIGMYPLYLLLFLLCMAVLTEKVNKTEGKSCLLEASSIV